MRDFYAELIENRFVDEVRQTLTFDETAYENLLGILADLAEVSKTELTIDRRVALLLYTIPQMIRNAYLSFETSAADMPEIAFRLEDAWVELDELVLAILTGAE